MSEGKKTMPTIDLDQPGVLPTDKVLVRTACIDDLAAVVKVDAAAMGTPRAEYYRAKLQQVLEEGRLATSVVAELDDHVVGFALSKVYYGEFGLAEPVAVLDSIGVDPAYRGHHVGQAMLRQLLMNLRALDVTRIETQVRWDQFDLLRFLAANGFGPAPRLCLELALGG